MSLFCLVVVLGGGCSALFAHTQHPLNPKNTPTHQTKQNKTKQNKTKSDVSDNPKLTTVPACISRLTSLHRLDLHSCNLEVVPPEVGALTGLRQVSLHFNRCVVQYAV